MTEPRQIGQRHLRVEDRALLQGKGRFVDDLYAPQMLEAAFVRSPHAHALIRSVNATAARKLPGVHAVLTLADIAPYLLSERLPLQFRAKDLPPDITPFALAKDEVAFVGEAVAITIADSRYIAEDAAALVEVKYDSLPVVADCKQGIAPGAPTARRGKVSNVISEIR